MEKLNIFFLLNVILNKKLQLFLNKKIKLK